MYNLHSEFKDVKLIIYTLIIDYLFGTMLHTWNDLLNHLHRLYGTSLFKTCFLPLQPLSVSSTGEKSILTLRTPMETLRYIRTNYLRTIEHLAALSFDGKPLKIILVPTLPSGRTPSKYLNHRDALVYRRIVAPHLERLNERFKRSGLRANYSFDTLLIGERNQFAVAAAKHVATEPGEQYNPLIIYSKVGMGKTHILQAIGHEYLNQHPQGRVLYISTSDFVAEFAQAARDARSLNSQKPLEQFDERYRNVDILLIDDIQGFLSTNKGSQAQFFNIFEYLVSHKKHIVLTSDQPISNLKEIQPRLISRLSQGLSVNIDPPSLENRMLILQAKARELNVELPTDVISFVAQSLTGNVRELEGALQQLIAFQNFQPTRNRNFTIELAKQALRDHIKTAKLNVSIEQILHVVSDFYKVSVNDLLSHRRPKRIAFARQIAMYLAKTLTANSFVEIGDKLGGRDHSTIVYAVRKIQQDSLNDTQLMQDIKALENTIKNL